MATTCGTMTAWWLALGGSWAAPLGALAATVGAQGGCTPGGEQGASCESASTLEDWGSLLQIAHLKESRNGQALSLDEFDQGKTAAGKAAVAATANLCSLTPGALVALEGGRSGKFCRDTGTAILCDSDTITPMTQFEVADAGGGSVFLKGPVSGGFCSDDGGARIVCDRTAGRLWEKFNVSEVLGGGGVTIRGLRDGSFCSDTSSGVRCFQGLVGAPERFFATCLNAVTKENLCRVRPGVIFALRGGRARKFCSDTVNGIICDSDNITQLQQFEAADAGEGLVAIKGNLGFCSDETGTRVLCNRLSARLWEHFLAAESRGIFTLRTMRDGSYCSDTTTGVRCNVATPAGWEQFDVACLGVVPQCRFRLGITPIDGDGIVVRTPVNPGSLQFEFCVDEACADAPLIFTVQNATKIIDRNARLGSVLGKPETLGAWPTSLLPGKESTFQFTWSSTRWSVSIDGARTSQFDFLHRTQLLVSWIRVTNPPGCSASFSIVKAPRATSATTTVATTTAPPSTTAGTTVPSSITVDPASSATTTAGVTTTANPNAIWGWPTPVATVGGANWCQVGVAPDTWNLKASCTSQEQVRVLAYNLYWWRLFGQLGGMNRSAGRLIAGAHAQVPFDFLGFQECDSIDRILADSGLNTTFTPIRGPYAVNSAFRTDRWTLLSKGQANVGEDETVQYYGFRTALWARLQSRTSNRTVFFLNHHGPLRVNMGGRCGGEATAWNMLRVIALNARRNDFIIMVGDFNADPTSATVRTLGPRVVRHFTGASFGGVDHIMSNCETALVSKRNLGSGGSDHDALSSILQF